MNRAWDYLLWVLLMLVAGATALSVAELLLGEEETAGVGGVVVPMSLLLLIFMVVGLCISLESTERGRSVRTASLARLAVLGGAMAAVLADLVGASRTSPLVYLALLCGAVSVCGLQRILLDRLPLPQFSARALRKLANVAGLVGVQLPIALVVCLGVATWIMSMLARGGPPLADEGALPLAELLVRVAAGVWSLVVLPLAMVVVAARVFGRKATGRSVPGELRVEISCPRCGDQRLRPFGRTSRCPTCGLDLRCSAPEMACGCGTTLVGVPGDRCPECDAAIRTRWGGPAVHLVASERPRPDAVSSRLWVGGAWICFALLPILLLWGELPIEVARWEIPRVDRVAAQGILVCAAWGMLLVASHAARHTRVRWLALAVLGTGGFAALASSAMGQSVLPRPLGGAAALCAWSMTLLGAATLAVLRDPPQGASEWRARGVLLLSLVFLAALLAVDIFGRAADAPAAVQSGAANGGGVDGAPGPESLDVVEVVESALKVWPEVVQPQMVLSRLAAVTAVLAVGMGLALVILRRLARRRGLRPEHFGLPRSAALALACPRCTARLRIPLRHARMRCEGCDLSVHARLREGKRPRSAALPATVEDAAPSLPVPPASTPPVSTPAVSAPPAPAPPEEARADSLATPASAVSGVRNQ